MPVPTLDFETYSEAGYVWNEPTDRKPLGWWSPPHGAKTKGLSVVGASVYSDHPTTEVLTASYDLCDGRGVRRWRPDQPLPVDLFAHAARDGAILESHNAMFERLIWTNVCVRSYGWPELPAHVQACSMATARTQSFPGALGELGAVLALDVVKDKEGKRLLTKFSVPRNPTKSDPRLRIRPQDDPEDFERLCAYCDQDVRAEMTAADAMDAMTPDERQFWLIDQEINFRGLAIDRPALRDCIAVLGQVLERYGEECRTLTGFNITQLEALKGWLSANGVTMVSMDADALEAELDRLPPHPPGQIWAPRRVLELRALTGSASVKKTYAMDRMASADDRLRDLFIHHGARTGRPTGADVQPLNLPKAGPKLVTCGCGRPHKRDAAVCPWCGVPVLPDKSAAWKPAMVDFVLEIMAFRSLDLVEAFFGDALLCISGCVRGLFVAGPGHDLIASDYSAIEAVVAAELAGEAWRVEAFHNNLPMYLVGASKITGTPLQTYLDYAEEHGDHHPDRQKIGKVSELACGYGGWVGSYLAFGSTEDEATIKKQILAWREASSAIVEMWGGQFRGLPWERDKRAELYGLEGMFVAACQSPGKVFDYRGIKLQLVTASNSKTKLMVTLLSGRKLTYHEPVLTPGGGWAGDEYRISYMTWNSNPKYGARGWVRMETYGGRLFENVVQAVAHDIQRYGIVLLREAGYPVVLHVYDEDCVEVPHGFGSIDEVEEIMMRMPSWAVNRETGKPWPIRAAGGWRGRRYRKG